MNYLCCKKNKMEINKIEINKSSDLFLIYGSGGWIGGMFVEYLKLKNINTVLGKSRVENSQDVKNELEKSKCTHVISFIGRTHGKIEETLINNIDYLEYPGKLVENIRDNLYSPLVLAEHCKTLNIHYTYIGTGCIFDGNEKVFSELDTPNYFGSSYSIVKGFTDNLMKMQSVLNLRIRMPISSVPNDRNFITKISKYSKICSLPNSMTVLDDFFPIFVDLMLNKKTGTINCVNPDVIDHNEILNMYSEIIGKLTWENMSLEEQSKILKSSRSNNALDTSVISSMYPELKSIKDSVKDVLTKYKSLL